MSARPIWRIALLGVDGASDISPRIAERFISLTLLDKAGTEADELSLVLSDSDGRLAIPPTGARLQLSLGWQGGVIVDKGEFVVDELEYAGAPDQLSIRARGAAVAASLGIKKERSWDTTTIGDIARTIAGEHGLSPEIHPDIDVLEIEHEDQTSESDVNLLARLAREAGARSIIKERRLILVPAGEARNIRNEPLAEITIDRRQVKQYRWSTTERTHFTGVRAYWDDKDAAERREAIAGGGDQIKTLRKVFPAAEAAQRAAEAEWRRLLRGEAKISITLAKGRPEAIPESPVRLTGFKAAIAGTGWVATELSHQVTGSGYTMTAELEIRQ